MSISASAFVQGVVEVVGFAVAVASAEAAGSDVGGAFADDGAGVVGKAVVPFGVEAEAELPEDADEELE